MDDIIILPYEGKIPIKQKIIAEEPPQPDPAPQKKKRKTYPQDWTNYNLFQTREKAMAYKLLSSVIDYIDIQQIKRTGRPSVDIREIIKCLVVKVYNDSSSRRINSELILFRGLGYITKLYHFNTICKYLSDPQITPHLEEIYKTLAEPMAALENYFAADSTGFSTMDKSRWSDVRLDFKQHKDYKKLHIICGTRTNVIASVKVTEGTCNDSPYFKPLLNDASKLFTIKEISADAGYLSRENCTASREIGAVPYIMPKKNVTALSKGHSSWNKMISLWRENEPKFRAHYHRRSNVESTFAMIKRKFGDTLKGKHDSTKYNEIMCKVVCHNLTILAECMIQFGIHPSFQ